jgi:hypothetical protein
MYVKWQNAKIVDNLIGSGHKVLSGKDLRRENIFAGLVKVLKNECRGLGLCQKWLAA